MSRSECALCRAEGSQWPNERPRKDLLRNGSPDAPQPQKHEVDFEKLVIFGSRQR
jgi:hypothetical protein